MGRAWSIEIAFSLESLLNWARNPLLLIHGLGYSKVADSDIDSQSGHPPAESLVFLMYSLSAKRFQAIRGLASHPSYTVLFFRKNKSQVSVFPVGLSFK